MKQFLLFKCKGSLMNFTSLKLSKYKVKRQTSTASSSLTMKQITYEQHYLKKGYQVQPNQVS